MLLVDIVCRVLLCLFLIFVGRFLGVLGLGKKRRKLPRGFIFKFYFILFYFIFIFLIRLLFLLFFLRIFIVLFLLNNISYSLPLENRPPVPQLIKESEKRKGSRLVAKLGKGGAISSSSNALTSGWVSARANASNSLSFVDDCHLNLDEK